MVENLGKEDYNAYYQEELVVEEPKAPEKVTPDTLRDENWFKKFVEDTNDHISDIQSSLPIFSRIGAIDEASEKYKQYGWALEASESSRTESLTAELGNWIQDKKEVLEKYRNAKQKILDELGKFDSQSVGFNEYNDEQEHVLADAYSIKSDLDKSISEIGEAISYAQGHYDEMQVNQLRKELGAK